MLPGRLYNVRMSQDDLHSFVQDVYCAQSTAMCCATVLPGRNNSLETERILSRLTLSTSKSSSLLSFQAGALQAAFCTLFYAKVLDLTSETHFRWRDPRLRICLLVQSGTLPKRAQDAKQKPVNFLKPRYSGFHKKLAWTGGYSQVGCVQHLRLKHHEGSARLFLRSFPAAALLTIYTDNDDTWSRCVEHDRSFRSVHRSGNRKTRFTLTRTTEQWHRCTRLRSKRSIGLHCTVPHVFTVSNELSVVRAQELNRV